MTTFTKHIDQPLTLQFNYEESLDATYLLQSISFTPNVIENSAEITLNLGKISETPSIFKQSFLQSFEGLDDTQKINFTISGYANGQVITHQASSTHIEKPWPEELW